MDQQPGRQLPLLENNCYLSSVKGILQWHFVNISVQYWSEQLTLVKKEILGSENYTKEQKKMGSL